LVCNFLFPHWLNPPWEDQLFPGEAAENESEDEPEEAEALGRVHESLPETLPAPRSLDVN